MNRANAHFLLLNIGHFLDHLVMLVFATVAALALSREWGMDYAALVPYATPGFVAFGVFSLPAGWLADRWSREGMMVVFFVGVGVASIATGFARTPFEIATGLFVVGMFAAIYHPVGLTLVYESASRAGSAIAANGVWGNLGVGSAALITGFFIDNGGWRAAFVWPGVVSIALGAAYALLMRDRLSGAVHRRAAANAKPLTRQAIPRGLVLRVTAIVLATTAVSGIIFQSTTFALPKVFDERLRDIASSASDIGIVVFLVFALASSGQLVVGRLLDAIGPRATFMIVTAIQALFFALMPGLGGWPAVLVAQGFMLGAFGQIPINDYIIGRLASPERRASIYGARFVVTFVVLAAALPLIAWVHHNWGFDVLFGILSVSAAIVFAIASLLPSRIPEASANPA